MWVKLTPPYAIEGPAPTMAERVNLVFKSNLNVFDLKCIFTKNWFRAASDFFIYIWVTLILGSIQKASKSQKPGYFQDPETWVGLG